MSSAITLDSAHDERAHSVPLLLVGTDHRSCPLDLRERVAYDAEGSEELLVHLLARPEVAEACVLSTCNRTEIYVVPNDDEAAYRTIIDLVFQRRAPDILGQGRLFAHRGDEAVRHLLSVASGLESMVLGEPEILGQVRSAASLAEAVGSSATLLQRLLRTAIKTGSRARSETGITSGAVSLGYVTVELARNIFTRLADRRVLLIGAGETGRLIARSLTERGANHLLIANRGSERTEAFLLDFPHATAVPFEQRFEAARQADLVVASTAATEPILSATDLSAVMADRPRRPLLAVDLGVPRNIEPKAAALENLFLHTIDSLDGLIQRNLRRRREAVPRVEEILMSEFALFTTWYRGLHAAPVITQLQKRAEAIRRAELERARGRFPEETHADLDRLTRSLMRKVLHQPTLILRGEGDQNRLELIQELFGLDERTPPDRNSNDGDEGDDS